MALDLMVVVETRVSSEIADNPDIEHFINEIFPDFRRKFVNKDFSIAELEDLNCQIDNYRSTLYHNLVISIRLAGGVIKFSKIINEDIDYVNNVLSSNSRKKQLECAEKAIINNVIPENFFDVERRYFPKKFISQFRQVNITQTLSLVKNYSESVLRMENLLVSEDPKLSDALKCLIGKEHHELADHACRLLEEGFGYPRGAIDSTPRDFLKKIKT